MTALRMSRGRLGAAALALIIAAGCESRPDKSPPPPPPRPPADTASAATPPPSAPSGDASGLPAAADSTVARASAGAFAGTWQGSYDAKKGSVSLPPNVKDKTHGGDDGKAVTGPGKVEIVISPEGEVRGKATGSLGDATLTGKVDEGGVLGAQWFPDDPGKPNAMTGVLTGVLKDTAIHGKIRVAGPDATIVREAQIDLARK